MMAIRAVQQLATESQMQVQSQRIALSGKNNLASTAMKGVLKQQELGVKASTPMEATQNQAQVQPLEQQQAI